MSSIDKFFEGYEEGDELYVTPSSTGDENNTCKFVLSGESGVSPEVRLSELEGLAKRYGLVWCESSQTYKMKCTKRLIDTIGE